MTGRDWDLTGARLEGLLFAEWLNINERPDNFLDVYQIEPQRAWSAAEAAGWVTTVRATNASSRLVRRAERDPWPELTAAGRLEVDRVRGLRNNPGARAAACREALLLWLAYGEGRDNGASADLMVTRDGWCFYADPFTVREVTDAATFLHDEGLITGFRYPLQDGKFSWMRPQLTSSGRRCVEYHDANVREFLSPQKMATR